MVLVSYDIGRTASAAGARRLRRMARACRDFGQRVQFSVFEIDVESAQWVSLKAHLIDIIDPKLDSLRFYYLGREWTRRVEHIGAKVVPDLNAPLVW